ncbi:MULTISPECIES: TolC family protein [unclassified Undibacterium]|uniref:TolC family protein n=1 Tax=unclassified Undibacterium TaxID=2630295 RepID=UPI002AC917A2|nr:MULTISPECIES: TolC family protein [unclassified Undibacterium]MEB0138316.1 TolC family protein [Undibacterium sp. CCC2.1]MEB0174157.1 TolC family protein [Undibacterium sp. CCC1.1]MEB0174691.1 TolC family protein [Undibacterium sp. CCC3.4]MEB0213888.1 TolC family protein [Undibacterium sp. 5I2]WPX42614.1 TolC family protein [Undibacterium sp. CCC3.4]
MPPSFPIRPALRRSLLCAAFGSLLLGCTCQAQTSQSDSACMSIPELSLQQALQLALSCNHDLKSARIAIDSAAAASTIAAAAPNPSMTIQTAGINPHLGIGAAGLRSKTVDSTWRIDQLIERGGKRELRSANAELLLQASRHDASDTRRQLRQAASAAYFDLIAAQYKLAISRTTSTLFKSTVAAANARQQAGDLAGADAARIRIDALRAASDARQAAADLLRTQSALLIMLGVDGDPQLLRAIDDWPGMPSLPLPASNESMLAQRADVKAAQARVEAAIAGRNLALAAKTRDISVGVQFEHYPTSLGNQQGSGNSYGVSVQIPLFTRYEFQGEIRAAEAALDAARDNLDKTRAAARADWLLAIETQAAASEQVMRFRSELLPAARLSAEAAEYAFKHGALAVMDVLDARRIYRATEMDAINAQSDLAKAQAMLNTTILELDK